MRLREKYILFLLICLSIIFPVAAQDFSEEFFTDAETNVPSADNSSNEPIIHKICGESEDERCICEQNRIKCELWWSKNLLKNPNLQPLISNFFVETVEIRHQQFGILKNNETLPYVAKDIKKLILSDNGITDIEDGTFDKFDQLQGLCLSNNKLTNLSSNILTEKLGSKLFSLNLEENLFSLPSINFENMKMLTRLRLGKNRLIGKTFATSSWIFPQALSNLTDLYLFDCNIVEIPEYIFANLKNLDTLYLHQNPITTYPKSLNKISTLRHLDLSSTQIVILNQTSLGSNNNLNELFITNSEISSIGDCAFCGFPNLTTLHLFKNYKLSSIDENSFGYAKNRITPKIESFSVERCNLQTIPKNLFDWNKVKEIGIAGNPFNCSCEMAWLINDINNKKQSPTFSLNLKSITDSYGYRDSSLKCEHPQIYRDVEFHSLKLDYCNKPNLLVVFITVSIILATLFSLVLFTKFFRGLKY